MRLACTLAIALVWANAARADDFGSADTAWADSAWVDGPVSFSANDRTFPANLRLPGEWREAVPLVVMLHGTGGIDGRGASYSAALNAAGIATLELDVHGAYGRPNGVPGNRSTSDEFIHSAIVALKIARQHAEFDAARIGLMGFSAGGHATLLLASEGLWAAKTSVEARYAAYLPLYPSCYKLFNHERSGRLQWGGRLAGPVQVITGALDGYDGEPETCGELAVQVAEDDRPRFAVSVLAGAHHGFDGRGDRMVNDPAANRGRGGPVRIAGNAAAAAAARDQAVTFFRRAFFYPSSASRKIAP